MAGIYPFTPRIWSSILTVLLLLTLSAYSWRRRNVHGALPFAIGCLLAVLCVVASGMADASTTIEARIIWHKFKVAWHLPAVSVMAMFVLEYTWPARWLSRRNLALLTIAPLLAVVILLTDPLHHLGWRGFEVAGVFTPLPGPVLWLFVLYGLALTLFEIVAFGWLYRQSPPHRAPVAIMLAGLLGSRVLYVLDLTSASPLPLYVLMLAYLYLMYAVALFGFHILDPVPFARRTVIEQMRGGVLVLDPQGRVAGANPAAEEIVGASGKRLLGRPFQEVLPAWAGAPAALQTPWGERTEIQTGAEADARVYSLESSPLRDRRGLEVGRLLLLQDITAQKQAQQQIVEQQRALAMLYERECLARELHDSLGQIFAFVNAQGQTVHRLLSRGDVAAADACVGRLVEVAREADADVRDSIMALHATPAEAGLFPALAHYLAQYEKHYDICVEVDRPAIFAEGVFEAPVQAQLLRILQEALTNVRKHAGARCVQVAFARVEGGGRITVRDQGQGFDPGTPAASNGDHIGLRVMRERAVEVGGRVSVRSAPGSGTEVEVWMPAHWPARSDSMEGAADG